MRRFLLVALLLVACAPSVTSGIVMEKVDDPAHDTTSYVPIYTTFCSGSGKSLSCHPQLTGMIPITTHHEETWRLHLRQPQDGRDGWIDVTAAQFEAVEVGDVWPPR